jgi:hypothetical protein
MLSLAFHAKEDLEVEGKQQIADRRLGLSMSVLF